MTRALLISITILTLASCGSTKEIRRANRAARLVEKAKRIDPSIARRDTALIPITVRFPSIQGRITTRPAVPTINEKPVYLSNESNTDISPVPAPIPFEDDTLRATVSFNPDGSVSLDYTIKPREKDTTATTTFERITPTVYKPMPLPWWKKLLMAIGSLTLIALAIYVSAKAIKP